MTLVANKNGIVNAELFMFKILEIMCRSTWTWHKSVNAFRQSTRVYNGCTKVGSLALEIFLKVSFEKNDDGGDECVVEPKEFIAIVIKYVIIE